ncbi:DNA replication and repair protein RecF [Paenibacillus sp. J31TS4]|uniref:DNA replication/repair protein RecF n=1 Tax=Paenibacillus sp. J31TS4 TaxID=2807195 RepID=UPI001AFF5C94|nr:DNA replication/repair protein RecF [Paenibacillus sp. J31TS4]GIP40651.1 DNA replication and repair protein RecF [Paenibacillus sp. J31TS4]
MFLNKLSLTNYRNYDRFELETSHQVNLFVGPNAQGKTNLLESIYVMALTKSHRTHQDKQLIRWNEDQALLTAEVDKRYGPVRLSLSITPQGKKAKINGLEQRKLSSFIGTLNVVMFAPEDLEIVKGAPGIRRRFLDMEIGQVHPGYLYEVTQYQKVLVQRNNYLKQLASGKSANAAMLDIWNEQLVQFGIKIMKKRQSFIKKLQVWAERIHAGITNGREEILLEYRPSFPLSEEEDEAMLFDRFMLKLSQAKEQEIRRGATLAGPHRDDMVFWINGKEVHVYGSQGQQRTTALSLKLAELELIREELGEYPLLLLDDVLSELDPYRQTQLIETFQDKVQTFVTTTSLDSVNMEKLRDSAVYHVAGGAVTEQAD